MKRKIIIGLSLLALAVCAGLAYVTNLPALNVNVPEYQKPGELVTVDQGWTDAQREAFHFTAQGTRLVPYAWFMALEQPCFSLSACKLFAEPEYLGSFGFLAAKADAQRNPGGLPVGFARQEDFHDPHTSHVEPVVGLTCAACHTGELRYQNYSVRLEGAPATIEVTEFQKALGLSMAFTQYIPFRYGRFEDKVLGPNATDAQKSALKQRFDSFMKSAKWEVDETNRLKTYANQAGFGRTDALARIGNQVFAVDMANAANFAMAGAPVRFPQIWDATWFDWVQYNSSISDPMVRNIGEALGVRAVVELNGPNAAKFDNSVNIPGLHQLELLLSGSAPFQGLRSPQWPSVFPPLAAAKVARGAVLYKQHCAGCHLPPVEELLADLKSPKPVHWWKNGQGKHLLKVTDVPLPEIGTDPRQAMDFLNRTADTGSLNKGRVSAAAGLDLVTTSIRDKFFDKMQFTPAQRIEWSGNRDPDYERVRSPTVYKARPLNGSWSIGPYLHNGSVPNLYELLSPASERLNKFWTGSKLFDPVKLGRDTAELKGGYLFDTSLPGNSNKGHEFTDGPKGNGVIGPKLSLDDRWALVEYLKSI